MDTIFFFKEVGIVKMKCIYYELQCTSKKIFYFAHLYLLKTFFFFFFLSDLFFYKNKYKFKRLEVEVKNKK